MNNCSFIGRLTKDPELKTTQTNKKYIRFCLAVDGIKDKDGNKSSDFIDCIVWNKSAEIIAQYCSKGSQLGVNGRLHTTTYEKDGDKRKGVEIIVNEFTLLGGSKSSSNDPEAPAEDPATTEDTFTPSLPFEV